MTLAFACILLTEGPELDYRPKLGPLPIASVRSLQLKDAKRDRSVDIRITYPKSGGPYPLIVLCHGLGGSKDGLLPLSEPWSRHGYVVIQPSFSDSAQYMTQEEKLDFLRARNPKVGDWKSRPQDVTFILDELGGIESKVPDLKGKIDRARIGVGGHSFGAHTSMLIGGIEPRTIRGRESFRDRRVRAIAVISGQGRGPQFDQASFDKLAVPMLCISGTEDRDPFGRQSPEARKDPYLLAPKGDKYLVWIQGAHHGFGGINGLLRFPGGGAANETQVAIVRTSCLAFWDAYLKGDPAAKAYLGSNRLHAAAKDASLSRR